MRVRLALAMIALTAVPAFGQASAVHKQKVEQSDFPGGSLHTVMVRTSVDPHGLVTPHTHPGLEIAYVSQGAAEVTIAGAARQVPAGQGFAVPPKTVHSVRNVGGGPLVIVSTYVVDPGQPIATPAH